MVSVGEICMEKRVLVFDEYEYDDYHYYNDDDE